MSNGSAERDIPRYLDPRILLSYGPVGSKRVPASLFVDRQKVFPSDGATCRRGCADTKFSYYSCTLPVIPLCFVLFPHACFHLFGPLSLLPAILQVDSTSFDALIEFISEGAFDTCEQVPARDEDGFLVNPLGGIAVDMAGPAGYVCYQQLV